MKIKTKSLASWVGVMALALLAPIAHADPVVTRNGGFEIAGSAPFPVADWTLADNAEKSGDEQHGGQFSIRLFTTGDSGDAGTGSVLQNVTLFDFEEYYFEFYLMGARNMVTATIGGAVADFFSVSDDDQDGWWMYQGFITNSTAGDLKFSFNSTSAAEAYVDDVLLMCVESLTGNCTGVPIGNNVPEPGSLLLVGAALASMAAIRRRKPI